MKLRANDNNNSVPAIFCSNPNALSETFVRRHIHLLNGGDSMVFCEASPAEDSTNSRASASYIACLSDRSVIRRSLRSVYIKRPYKLAATVWQHLVAQDYPTERISFNLFEFGYLLVRHWDYALFSGKPFFVYFRGQDASKLLLEADYVRKLRFIMPHASGSIFVAPTLKVNLDRLNIPVGRSLIQPSGVDTTEFIPGAKNPNLIVSVGRFVEKKAHEDTIRAFSRVVSQYPNLKLMIFGDGERLMDCMKLIEELSLGSSVKLPGPIDHNTIKKWLSIASFYIQSSKIASDGDSEGFPSAIQEALASGAAVLTTSHAGSADFLTHRANALLCREGDTYGMSDNLLEILGDRSLWLKLVANGRLFAEQKLDGWAGVKTVESFIAHCINEDLKEFSSSGLSRR